MRKLIIALLAVFVSTSSALAEGTVTLQGGVVIILPIPLPTGG